MCYLALYQEVETKRVQYSVEYNLDEFILNQCCVGCGQGLNLFQITTWLQHSDLCPNLKHYKLD